MGACWYQWEGADLLIRLRVIPRAGKDAIAGPYGDALKVRIAAAPVEGAANAHLIEWCARLCKVPRTQVTVEAGSKGRDKRLRIHAPMQLFPGVERN